MYEMVTSRIVISIFMVFSLLATFRGDDAQALENRDKRKTRIIRMDSSEVELQLTGSKLKFPKYSTQLMNLANRNAQATRPKVVGQMSELIREFEGTDYKEWEAWYQKRHPEAIDRATRKIMTMIDRFRKTLAKMDEDMVRNWVKNLVLTKTFAGFRFQDAIIPKIAKMEGRSFRFSTPSEESQGIDGFIGNVPVSVKPVSYRGKQLSGERIDVKIIYYEHVKGSLFVYLE